MLKWRLCALLLAIAMPALGACGTRATLTIAAASDLNQAFTELGKLFEQKRQVKLAFSFGSTGHLSRQIENGAPFDIFAAANASFVEALGRKGLILPDTQQIYAQGRLTLWQRQDATFAVQAIEDLARPEVRRIAIANPEHAPYGQAAEQALRAAGLWERLHEKLLWGENVSQTRQYAETGNVDVAIVALSISPRPGGRYVLVDAKLHAPINQVLCVLKRTRQEALAREFVAFLQSPEGHAVMKRYGFRLPGEMSP